MSLKIQNSRQLLKRSTVSGATPTVFTGSTDYTDGTWGVDDIYGGELYLNMVDKKLWFGWENSGGTGVELIYPQAGTPGPSFTGGSGNCITDFYLTNMYGCSPITIWDDLILQQGVTINSFNSSSTITMDDTGGNSILHLDLANLSAGNTFVRLNRFGDVDMGTDDTTDFYISTFTPNSFNRYLNYGAGYNVLRDIAFSAPQVSSVEQINDSTNFLTQSSVLDTTTGEVIYSVTLSDASPQSSFQMTKDDINLTLAGGVTANLAFGPLVDDVTLQTRVAANNEQSYHYHNYKAATNGYQQLLVTENTINDSSASVSLSTPSGTTSIVNLAVFSGTNKATISLGNPAGFTAYADMRVSANTEAYIEVRESEITMSPALNVIGTITGTSYYNIPFQLVAAASDETTAITTGTTKVTFRMPCKVQLTEVRASLTTAQTSGSTFTVDINSGGTSILSTKITIDNTEKTSTSAATPPVISSTTINDDAEMTVDVDVVGNGTAKGLKVTLIGKQI